MTRLPNLPRVRQKAVWGPKRTAAALLLAIIGIAPSAAAQSSRAASYRLDAEVTRRAAGDPARMTSVIVTLVPGATLPSEFRQFARGGRLDIINGQVLDIPNGLIRQLEARPEIFRVHYNRPTASFNYRTSVTTGATWVREFMGYRGQEVGIAVIDSGIASWHDDLSGGSGAAYPFGDQRVRAFVDFVNGRTQPYDDNGHGTHVAGVVVGNGYDSYGEKAGIAPQASIVSLKVLDAYGRGTIGHMIAALNWIAQNHQTYGIRVVNMSVGARVTESYWTDPLTLATKVLVDRGIVVVGAAGNFGKNASGQLQYGGITAPANAPWVLTVGASSTNGTVWRYDDTLAGFSSAGPTSVDYSAKPDLVAPGTGIVSLAAPGSTFYAEKEAYLVAGRLSLGYKPYLTLSGTSMAAPVVSGTVALMLQANPSLTPNLVKAILQYTAQRYPGYDALRQGAGFLNTLGAVRLARFYAINAVGSYLPIQSGWSKQIIWGNHRVSGGYINPKANAWANGVTWGAVRGLDEDNIIWGTDCPNGVCDNIIWSTFDADLDNVIWGTDFDNIIWGTGFDNVIWGTDLDNVIWGTLFDGDNVIWGTEDADNVIWGTDCGGADCDNVIWGTSDSDNVIWGTAEPGASVVWLSSDLDNVIWGTTTDDATWATSGMDEVIFPDDADLQVPDATGEFGDLLGLGSDSGQTVGGL